jgi:8-amino-7-oxononanoate synthase
VVLEFLGEERRRRLDAGLQRELRAVDGAQGTHLVVDGRRVLSLCSNNYLGLANHPALREAAERALRDLGVGAGSSRLVSGSMQAHHAAGGGARGAQAGRGALVFTSGYQANIGAIGALVGRDDEVFSDELNHASLIDGCRLSRARISVYPHNDMERLEAQLAASTARRRLIVTDSVFSMDGDEAPLAAICDLADRFGAMTLVDEAHATGAVGPHGSGVVGREGLQERVTVQMGTLGKALGCFGAFVAARGDVVDHLVNRARTLIYTTALPPPVVAAAVAALELLRAEPQRRDALRRNARRLHDGLVAISYSVPGEADSHILPVIIGDADATMRLSAELLERGVFAHGIRPPTVPTGTSRIRATVMATHSEEDIDDAIAAFRRVKKLRSEE